MLPIVTSRPRRLSTKGFGKPWHEHRTRVANETRRILPAEVKRNYGKTGRLRYVLRPGDRLTRTCTHPPCLYPRLHVCRDTLHFAANRPEKEALHADSQWLQPPSRKANRRCWPTGGRPDPHDSQLTVWSPLPVGLLHIYVVASHRSGKCLIALMRPDLTTTCESPEISKSGIRCSHSCRRTRNSTRASCAPRHR